MPKAIDAGNTAHCRSVPLVTRNKYDKQFTIAHPVRLGIVPHQAGKVSYFALDFDAQKDKNQRYLQPKTGAAFSNGTGFIQEQERVEEYGQFSSYPARWTF